MESVILVLVVITSRLLKSAPKLDILSTQASKQHATPTAKPVHKTVLAHALPVTNTAETALPWQ